jgi:GNAT superfamily N-acetyltransferase
MRAAPQAVGGSLYARAGYFVTERPALVRLATPADEDALYDLLMALVEDNNSFGFECDEERIRAHIRMGTERTGGAHGVIDVDGRIAGSVGIINDRWWFSRQYGLAQLWLFVRPEYRRLGYADDLVNWAKWFREQVETGLGHKIGLVNCMISEKRFDLKLRWWRRHSGKMIGGIFEIR